jgi:hypothetical protein
MNLLIYANVLLLRANRFSSWNELHIRAVAGEASYSRKLVTA